MNRSTQKSKSPIMTSAEMRLFAATGEELLLMAIAGRSADREQIALELDQRAMFAEGPRRPRISRANVRIKHRRAA